jgi:hypothetical protein
MQVPLTRAVHRSAEAQPVRFMKGWKFESTTHTNRKKNQTPLSLRRGVGGEVKVHDDDTKNAI